jgi:fermentation-respiration switch protein FrsA (DUF1100 family)
MTDTTQRDSKGKLKFGRRPRRGMLFRLWQVLRAALVCYLTLILLLMMFEEYMIFPAPQYPQGNWNPNGLGHEDAFFTAEDGTKLHGWYLEHPQPRAYLLIAHGNAEHVAYMADELRELRDRFQASVFAFDYRGYGRSEGSPREKGVLADGRAAQAWLAQRAGIAPSDIVLMGRSLGGAVVVDMAVNNGARGLILERTFTSLPDVAARHYPWAPVKLLMRNRFDSLSKIKRYHGPLLQSHGTYDEVVPLEIGRRLFDAAPSTNKLFFPVEGAYHNDPHSPQYNAVLQQFLDALPPLNNSQPANHVEP